MNTQEILALAPGPELDAAVHRLIFHENGIARPYSTDAESGALLLMELPSLFVMRPEKPKDGLKPWIAGTLASDPSSTAWHSTLTVSGGTMLGVLCRAALLVAVKAPPAPLPEKPAPESGAGRATVQPAKRPATNRANGAQVPVSAPISAPVATKPTQRPIQAIRQPTIFLQSRSKLAPLPKRKPFSMPGDPAK